jgi:hypothetical protein
LAVGGLLAVFLNILQDLKADHQHLVQYLQLVAVDPHITQQVDQADLVAVVLPD